MTTTNATQTRAAEVREKIERVRTFLQRHSLAGALFTTQPNVSWATAGAEDLIVRGKDAGFVYALITEDGAYLLTQNIEGPRISAEEDAANLGYEVRMYDWWTEGLDELVASIADPSSLANDGFGPGKPMQIELQELRLALTVGEQARMRELGRDCCEVIERETVSLESGMTGRQLAARIVFGLEERAIFPRVLLIGGDERRRTFRHPTVSDHPISRDVLTVIVGVRDGLHVAMSRTASIGPVDPVLVERHRVAARVDAAYIAATKPGSTWGEALQAGIDAYVAAGYEGEWQHHYQGGPIAYDTRDFTPTPKAFPNAFTNVPILEGQGFAWNPTVQGAKMEDTFITRDGLAESISNSDSWPTDAYSTPVGIVARPAIKEL